MRLKLAAGGYFTYRLGHGNRYLRHPYVALIEILDSTFGQRIVPEPNKADSSIRDDYSIGDLVTAGEMRSKLIAGEIWRKTRHEDAGIRGIFVFHCGNCVLNFIKLVRWEKLEGSKIFTNFEGSVRYPSFSPVYVSCRMPSHFPGSVIGSKLYTQQNSVSISDLLITSRQYGLSTPLSQHSPREGEE